MKATTFLPSKRLYTSHYKRRAWQWKIDVQTTRSLELRRQPQEKRVVYSAIAGQYQVVVKVSGPIALCRGNSQLIFAGTV